MVVSRGPKNGGEAAKLLNLCGLLVVAVGACFGCPAIPEKVAQQSLLVAGTLPFLLLAGTCFSFSLVPMPCVASPSSGAVVMGQAVPQAADGGVGISKNRGAAVLTADKTVSLFSG